ncbi:Bug family tripartite tricarboxylate transporter substrate binding protein [Sabulicella glaciei]|uniref:Tripartite tricarboxylate transporter substrate-binding protein n=1 Tax=Sabulicella glaciei TaxID=2984948 RepID=A0ABT3NQE8_9PROT|nr:tripartite tricarboxylate transporter substrate-binding protein [Roseococcus sp. MDT2-1-1]MCW8084395.1 tripartite tricarboxylate transporter substrate-binding protein [Roseococcus sp. MDT2-1-1]
MLTRRALPGLFLAAPAFAQAFPQRPIRLVIPFTAGGSNDILGRILAEGMAMRLGVPIVVENRGGAGGVLGNDLVAKAPADGHTVLLAGSGSFVISALTHPRLPYDPERDFTPVGLLGASPNIIAADPRLGIDDLAELREKGRAANPSLTFGTAGAGTTAHALGAMTALTLGIPLEFVHYRGTAPALQDVLAGRVSLISNAAAPFIPFLSAGTLRGIAVAGRERSKVAPAIPTSAEQGFPDLDSATWYGLVTPAGTPDPVRARLLDAMNATLADAPTAARIEEQGCEIETSRTPEDFGRFLARERQRWGVVVDRGRMREG